MTEAHKVMYLGQLALTKSLKKLELQLGLRMFVRHPRDHRPRALVNKDLEQGCLVAVPAPFELGGGA